ncbi:class I SAM-dependent methyltransferase [bacterium]|nr:class I SAM-dependent methyltransferase [bacterium]
MSGFYQSIAPWYDRIFPVDPEAVAFAAKRIGIPAAGASAPSVLDAGCGTGGLALALAGLGFRVTGIDSDADMVRLATEKCRAFPNAQFEVMDLRDAGSRFYADSFSAAVCFGNTLVHLTSRDEISGFIRKVRGMLKKDGLFLAQILNYDWILDQGLTVLPAIEDDKIRFERTYRPEAGSERFWFRTVLTVKSGPRVIENAVPLIPLRRAELAGMLANAGFGNVEWFGDFNGGPLTEQSLPLIVVAG